MTRIPAFAVDWDGQHLLVLDQTQLPSKVVVKHLEHINDVYGSIKRLEVRGAPSIGICGAMGLAMWAKQNQNLPHDEFMKQLEEAKEFLNSSRPTAVNLSWALDRLFKLAQISGPSSPAVALALEQEALKIREENVAECKAIGKHGLSLCRKGDTMMTICNTGGIATARYGTALAIFLLGQEEGMSFKVYALETRPLLQGSRLTMWELQNAGVDATLITDSTAATILREKPIARVVVGADRIAHNGDTANKIGTYGLAVLAKAHNVPFYVAAPSSTFDKKIATGADIIIEQRSPDEVRGFQSTLAAPPNCQAFNPAFDVTPHDLIAGYITEKGVLTASEIALKI
eukprot:Blabericola_migrator_1__6083@NODE_306_length_10090_cov_155_786691_g250_i0_p4_GENE_NODE_306_length_10090_cov_155_786691_g250_i0NODE_306_length_10090_cov_155_786691_g250_i0_p4_ORF_typecomplete_len344_score65_61IF2B/PF01008_17/4_2e82SelA/PF03841_13/0_15_NODE_306_length_10090_cov_155_786691_g250_i054206451